MKENLRSGLAHGVLTFVLVEVSALCLALAHVSDLSSMANTGMLSYFFLDRSSSGIIKDVALIAFFIPIIEELACRIFPLWLATKLSGKPPVIWMAVISTSVAYSLIHGVVWTSLLLQGTMGFIFATVYLEHGALGCISAHVTNNILALTILALYLCF